MTSEEARLLLSYSGLIVSLATDQRMSASEISRILAARDRRLSLNWHAVKAITQESGCAAVFALDDMIAAYRQSTDAEPSLLADLTVRDATDYVGSLGVALGCARNLAEPLRALVMEGRHDPYLMILHFQLSPLQTCDHAVTFAYEFSPRGQAAEWLKQRYLEAGLAVGSSPYLNNAKALLRFDRSWAWGREDHLERAQALVTVLQEVETLGALPKVELGRYICALLCRLIRMTAEQQEGELAIRIPAMSPASRRQVLAKLTAGNSGTNGILEQRLVDAAATASHIDWVERGRGDSVFAASTFRRKLGDIELIRLTPVPSTLIGYESRGGRLTASYVAAHMATFEAVLRRRRDELETAAPLAAWRLKTIFVSHSAEDGLPTVQTINIDGTLIIVHLSYTSFAAMATKLDDDESDCFERYFIDPLNQLHVPAAVRDRVMWFLN